MISFPDSFAQLHSMIFDIDRIPPAVVAILITLVIGMITGPVRGNANPFLWGLVDMIFGRIGDKLDKLDRSRSDLTFRGFVIFAMAVLLAGIMAEGAKLVTIEYNYMGLAESVFVALALSTGAVWFALLRYYFALSTKGQMKKGGYYAMARTSRIDLNTTDEYGMTRLGMALSVRCFDKALVTPIIWYLIGGLSALYVYAVIAGLAWRFGKDGYGKGFGAVPLAIEKLLGVVPSLLAAFFVTAASVFTPTSGIVKSIRSWFGAKSAAPYSEGGYPVTALAWGLNVSLGGPAKDLNGSALKKKWVGPQGATAKIEPYHMKRALYTTAMAQLLFVVALLAAYLWGSYFPVK